MKNPLYRNFVFIFLILLTNLVLSQFALAAQIKLTWDPNPEYDLRGYKVYYGRASGTYGTPINVGNVTTCTLTGLTRGQTYFIAIKAYDTCFIESNFSEEVTGHAIDPPPAATLISPTKSETLFTTTPTYTWNAALDSSWYYLWVNDSTGTKIQKWYKASETNCATGTGTCSVTPTTALVAGVSNWWIQTYNSAGYGPWSTGVSFTVSPPGQATLISPSGTITTTAPTYTWNAVTGSTWYCLWVNDSVSNKMRKWYSALEAGCSAGTGTCSVTPTTVVGGSCKWWVQTYSSVGYGSWSAPLSFTAPGAATLVSPSGTIFTPTPIYTWSAVPGSTWYYLWVSDSTGTKIQKWFTASDAGCASGTGICSVTQATALVAGVGNWWIQTYNSAGYGPWSTGVSFTVSPPGQATLISPFGTIYTPTPTYTWNAVSGSTWYYLWVNDSTGTKIQKWYTASEAGCASGTGACSVTPTTRLLGSSEWWIQTYNSVGYGPWSSGMDFTVSP